MSESAGNLILSLTWALVAALFAAHSVLCFLS